MVLDANEECEEEVYDELQSSRLLNARRLRDNFHINITPLQTRLLSQSSRRIRLLDFLRSRPSVEWLKAPFAIFRITVLNKEATSRSVASPAGIRRRFHLRFMRKINWASLSKICKEWMKNPVNVALLSWLIFVAGFVILLFLLLTGIVDSAFSTKTLKNRWIEICNQVLNALFTLMSLFQHPYFFHHLVMLCRWRSEDIIELRKMYCKNGAYRPHEWAHMMVVVVLLHITCFAQYILCGLYWGYTSATRPEFLENLCIVVGILAPVSAGMYTVYSPLGREFEPDSDEESQGAFIGSDANNRNKFGLKLYDRRVVVSRPEWIGGLFDCRDDMMVAYLSFFCTCCVFGWNMERLGFGNMYVHIVTFLLLCIAPFWIFNITALHIQNEVVGYVVGITGLVLCLFGLLYGGFWRIQMRKRFKLPGNKFCCNSRSWTDYFQWMFCCACSLAQEVRTGNFYDVEDDSLYRRKVDDDDDEDIQSILQPLPREGGSARSMGSVSSTPRPTSRLAYSSIPLTSPEEYYPGGLMLVSNEGLSSTSNIMVPPSPLFMQFKDQGQNDDTMALLNSSQIHVEATLPRSN